MSGPGSTEPEAKSQTHSRDPLGGVEYWLQQLPPQCPKILVAARIDRGSSTLTHPELEQFCRQRGISGGFIETSALTITRLERMHPQTANEIARRPRAETA